MKKQGIVIFSDGKLIKYGNYVCTDEANYLSSPSHQESFEKEVVDSFDFKLADLFYDKSQDLYTNGQRLSQEGLILIFNNQLTTTNPSQVLSYVPSVPTSEQLEVLLNDNDINNIAVQDVYEFNSNDWDDYLKYNSFKNYVEIKNHSINNKK